MIPTLTELFFIKNSKGWFHFGLQVPANQLVNLTNDTLTILIEFDNGPTLASTSSATAQQSLDSQALYPLFPAAHYDLTMENVFDNAALSDFAFIAEGKPIHVQKQLVAAKLSAWKAPNDFRVDSPPTHGRPEQPACSVHPFECIPNTSHTALHSFLAFPYSGRLPLLESENTASDARLFGQLCILAESFGVNNLYRYCMRRFDTLLNAANAVELLMLFGHESDTVQELIVFLICEEFGAVRETTGFQSLLSSFVEPGDREEQCMKSKRFLAILRRLKAGTTAIGDSNTSNTSERDALSAPPAMDPVRSVAFRQLLSTPSVSDVRFVVGGEVVGIDDQDGVSVVRVDDFPHATFLAMLDYLYVSELDPHANLMELGLLYVCADKYQITELSELVLSRISDQMSPETVSHFLFGYAYQYEVLNSLAQEYFVRNFNLVRKSTEFVHVVRSYWEYEEAIESGIWTDIFKQFTEWDFETMPVLPEESGGVDGLLRPSEDADNLNSTETQANPLPIKMDACIDGSAGEGRSTAETDSVAVVVPDAGNPCDELGVIEALTQH
ncbi:hypothetical protein HDU77_001727 [Chytriomyces hyalinus]|nr:hypothetical protein HDU77_001727 [Chytriomyces hyalinus]